ncbi:MAG TPA: CDP-alcohol phosphatidyltransferase family protein, partial [Candidatus Scybalomonas excrementigallinarum]|nr:CDP-alcohol phosphatidyltransferase family protein [Candidatus Scybalomonas excrementigallinarum]
MLGVWDYTVILTYISLGIAFLGMIQAIGGNMKLSILCLALSGICDMFDGKIARTKKDRTHEEQMFGIQIDSLCDLVCFGVLPAIITYQLSMKHIFDISVLIVFLLAGLVRLAHFNVSEEKRQKEEKGEVRKYYQGLPITSIAIFLPVLY